MNLDIYDAMIENDEMWYINEHGNGFIMSDASLMDC